MSALLVAAALLAPMAAAQTTWHNLRFGMTEGEAKAQLGSSATRPKPVVKIQYEPSSKSAIEQEESAKLPDYAGLECPVEVDRTRGTATVSFTKKDHRMTGVTLTLYLKDLRDDSDRLIAAKAVLESLENKYGEPFRVGDGMTFVERTWRTKEQIVTYTMLAPSRDQTGFILIKYAPKASEI